ncbi:non-ribosomal peptide synthetase [Pseudomonas putida]|uniref:non-ribosomal peptide synthetase n=1 Tax=Pseudomonas putida TaxID=303 RepID=UPI0015FDCD1D|nr:non-ribosomal peptide synthetase [Pseudomonas putida]
MDTAVATKIAQRFINLPLEKRRQYLQKMLEEGVSPANLPIPLVRDDTTVVPLSFAQERQWFLWQMEPQGTAYNIGVSLRLHGPLNLQALQGSFDALLARHESLRTTFTHDSRDGGPRQQIAPQLTVAIECREHGVGDEQAQIQAFVEAHREQPFDLQHGPVLRVALLRLAAEDHVLSLVVHHIAADGWSLKVMVDELLQGYSACCQGHAVAVRPLPIQYADYAIWQRRWMEAGERERQLAYWQAQLGGQQPVLELPTDRPRPGLMSYRGARHDFSLPAELCQRLQDLARHEGVTLFVLLLAAFQALLQRYSGQQDIRVGVPIANRNRVETEGLIGFFVNTQVLRAQIEPQQTFRALLQQARQAASDAQAHQELPFEQLVEALQPGRSLSHSPLFQVMFNHQRQGNGQQAASDTALRIEALPGETRTAPFDLTLETFEAPGQIGASFNYATDLFDATTIARMAGHWLQLLDGIVADAGQRIAALPLLSDRELDVIGQAWNDTAVPVADACIQHLIEQRAHATPHAPAVQFEDQTLSYQQLNEHANRLAWRLIEGGVGPDVKVGVALERSPQMLVALLAVLKAGGAYVPLDPHYPDERLAYMMEDSGIRLLLTQPSLQARLPIPATVQCLLLAPEHPLGSGCNVAAYSVHNPQPHLSAEHLAYMIYTSGSTGRPKGVMVPHGALVNFIASMAKAPGLATGDRLLSLTTFSFDIFGLELYLPLVQGACVVLAGPDTAQDPQRVLELVAQQSVTVLQATPSTWRMLLDSGRGEVLAGCTKLCGGEALSDDLAQRLLALGGPLWNLYGPTETTIWSALHRLQPARPQALLGRPLDNTRLYLLGEDLAPVPVGVAGELLIGGAGLARGYYQRPGLTAERFVPDPFAGNGERLYRTGDLARYRAEGVVEYLGRIDQQVKMRGYRIELGEIEAQLARHPAIREAAVVARPGPGGQQLVAYLVPQDVAVVDDAQTREALGEALKRQLRSVLPEYMVPTWTTFVATFPHTPNGKLDRNRLPAPDLSVARVAYLAPQSELQQQVAQIWQEVLHVDQVGLADNFFDLGGHSLLATQVTVRLREQLKLETAVKALFTTHDLQTYCAEIAGAQPHTQAVNDALAKSLEALKRLSAEDLENLIS